MCTEKASFFTEIYQTLSQKLYDCVYVLRAQIVRGGEGGGNILFINIKIECLAVQDLKIMAFRFLKTLVLWLFDFVPPYRLIPPIHFRKIEMTTKNSGGFIR